MWKPRCQHSKKFRQKLLFFVLESRGLTHFHVCCSCKALPSCFIALNAAAMIGSFANICCLAQCLKLKPCPLPQQIGNFAHGHCHAAVLLYVRDWLLAEFRTLVSSCPKTWLYYSVQKARLTEETGLLRQRSQATLLVRGIPPVPQCPKSHDCPFRDFQCTRSDMQLVAAQTVSACSL
eukprot:s6674_g2.t1